MHRRMVPLLFVAVLSVGIPTVGAARLAGAGEQQKQEPSKKAKPDSKDKATSSLTGCIDEQDGQYVLIREQSRELIANLVADGFPVEGFAKHVGHKVTVRGANGSDTSRPVFQVRSIETINDSCAPQQL